MIFFNEHEAILNIQERLELSNQRLSSPVAHSCGGAGYGHNR